MLYIQRHVSTPSLPIISALGLPNSRQGRILHLSVVPVSSLGMLCTSGIAKKNRIRVEVEVENKHIHIYKRSHLIKVSLIILTGVLYLNLPIHYLASTTDKDVTPITNRSLPYLLPAITHYKFTRLRIPARRKLSHNIQSWGFGSR